MLSGEIVGYSNVNDNGIAKLLIRDSDNRVNVVLCDDANTQRALAKNFPTGCFLGQLVSYEIDELGNLTGIGPFSVEKEVE